MKDNSEKSLNYSVKWWEKTQKNLRENFFKEKKDLENSLEYGKKYISYYLQLIKHIAKKTNIEVFGSENPKGIALFSFGSPSRYEMLGESDLDLLIVRENKNKKFEEFHKKFVKKITK
jgi:UTP:GlnB (protein PII) uridylyltransferase